MHFFALLELVFTYRTINLQIIGQALLNMLTGQSFDHMWYLYMLIGLYLITPVIKPFLKKSGKKDILCFLVILFVFKSLRSAISAVFNINIEFDIPIFRMNIFYYILGYYAAVYGADIKKPLKSIIYILLSAAALYALAALNIRFQMAYEPLCEYGSLFVIITAYNIFMLFKCFANEPHGFIKSAGAALSPLCLGIYIIHPLFIHLLDKVFKISPLLYPNIGFSFAFAAVIFTISAICVFVYKKIWGHIAAKF